MSASAFWATSLAQWGIPEEILAQAPENPWTLPPALFATAARWNADTPSHPAARAALGERGTVLDVGCGPGAGSIPLAERASAITGVDESADMLAAFHAAAASAGVAVSAVQGRWPDVVREVDAHDVVVCHHVVYNVPDIEPFLRALDDHARRRVVVELTAEHPRTAMNPLWQQFWGLERPTNPTADDFVAVCEELGFEVRVEPFETGSLWEGADVAELVAFVRRSLCLPASRDAEVHAALAEHPVLVRRRLVTVWWDAR